MTVRRFLFALSSLLLLPVPFGSDSSVRRAVAVDTIGNSTSGSWQGLGPDSILVHLGDVFTQTSLRVIVDGRGLSGSGNGSTDEVAEVRPGEFEPKASTWRVHLRSVECDSVPHRLWESASAA